MPRLMIKGNYLIKLTACNWTRVTKDTTNQMSHYSPTRPEQETVQKFFEP